MITHTIRNALPKPPGINYTKHQEPRHHFLWLLRCRAQDRRLNSGLQMEELIYRIPGLLAQLVYNCDWVYRTQEEIKTQENIRVTSVNLKWNPREWYITFNLFLTGYQRCHPAQAPNLAKSQRTHKVNIATGRRLAHGKWRTHFFLNSLPLISKLLKSFLL